MSTPLTYRLLARRQAMADLAIDPATAAQLPLATKHSVELRTTAILAAELAAAAAALSHGYARLLPARPYVEKHERRKRDVR